MGWLCKPLERLQPPAEISFETYDGQWYTWKVHDSAKSVRVKSAMKAVKQGGRRELKKKLVYS